MSARRYTKYGNKPIPNRHDGGAARLFLLFLTAFLALSAPVFAAEAGSGLPIEEMSLEELMEVVVGTVSGASKYRQDIREAPASVTVVTSEQITRFGYRNLAEVLQSVRGFYVTNDRNYFYPGIRGISFLGDYGTRILLLLDGIRINDGIFGQTPIGFDFPVDIDLIDRVEIIRGPTQSLYGNNAVLGVINVITRQPAQIQGGEVAGAAGALSTYGGRVSYGRVFNKTCSGLFSGSYQGGSGERIYFREFDSPGTNNGWADRADGFRVGSGILKLSIADFTLEGIIGSTRKSVPTASWGTIFNDNSYRTTDTRAMLSLAYNHGFADKSDLMLRLTGAWYRYSGDYPFDQQGNRYLQRDGSEGDWWGAEFNYVKKLFTRHKIVFGGEYQNNYRQDQWIRDPYVNWQDRHSGYNAGLFLQDEFRVLEDLTLHAGFRYDYFSTFGGTLNYRVGLLYHPFSRTTLKALYGTAFRAPNAYELYYSPPQIPLKNENSTSYELIVEQGINRHLTGSVSFYLSRLENVIKQGTVADQNGNFPFINGGRVETRGIEAELEGVWEDGWRARVSYAYQQARDVDSSTREANSPATLVKAAIQAPLYLEKVFLGVEGLYTGGRKGVDGSSIGDNFITNLTLSARDILPGLDTSLSLYNLFDVSYRHPGGEEHLVNGTTAIPQPGRSFQVKLTYRFP